jgi:anti-sigma regulatory factor (Ser/Thr protein kinase)
VLAVHEAAANAVNHAGGTGQILLWLHTGDLYAEISDSGAGIPERHRSATATPGRGVEDGRGLWLIRQLCAGLDIDTGDTGTRLLLRYGCDGSAVPGPDPYGEQPNN